jgi:hypothetical protein
MATTLILDSEALNALARAHERPVLAERARAILRVAYDEHALVRVPAPVLAEVCRGSRFDAAIDRVLNGRGIAVQSLDRSIARRAGGLLAKAGLGSAHAVDAFVVAAAQASLPAVIATGDVDDLTRIAGSSRGLRMFRI